MGIYYEDSTQKEELWRQKSDNLVLESKQLSESRIQLEKVNSTGPVVEWVFIAGRFVIYSFHYKAINLLLCKSSKGIIDDLQN